MLEIVNRNELTDDMNPWTLAKENDVKILSHMTFNSGFIDPSNRLVSALFTSIIDECYSFDVVVASGYKYRELAAKMVDLAMEEAWESQARRIEVHVFREEMRAILSSNRFRMTNVIGKGEYIMRFPLK